MLKMSYRSIIDFCCCCCSSEENESNEPVYGHSGTLQVEYEQPGFMCFPRENMSFTKVVQVWRTVFNNYEDICPICEVKKIVLDDRTTWHVSHVLALNKGGSNELANLKPVCSRCNLGMRDQHMVDYIKNNCREPEKVYSKLRMKL